MVASRMRQWAQFKEKVNDLAIGHLMLSSTYAAIYMHDVARHG